MRARLIAAGTRLPHWVDAGYAEYANRFGPGLHLELIEIPIPRRRGSADVGRAMATVELARWLQARLAGGRDLAFVIGGPDGLSKELLARADFRWSLSPLTWPHGLVRVMVAEQLYRAQSVLKGHPYHRG
jgi:23S rRNA (pseudouridine1915-N3)-methyltransferase